MDALLPAVTALIGVFIGAILTPRVTAGQAHRAWLRDKRAQIYENYAMVLQQVAYVVNYEDRLNFRLGKVAQKELLDAAHGLDEVASDFAVYASEEMTLLAERIRHSFWVWQYGVTIRSLTEAEQAALPPEEHKAYRQQPWMTDANPMEENYPWDRIEAAGEKVLEGDGGDARHDPLRLAGRGGGLV